MGGTRRGGSGGSSDDGALSEEEIVRDRERAALVSLALAQLEPAQEVQLRIQFGELVPSLEVALRDLADLTAAGVRTSHRALSLQLLAKVARHRGIERLLPVQESLRTFAAATIVEQQRIDEGRQRREREAKAKAKAKRNADAERLVAAAEAELATADPAAFGAPGDVVEALAADAPTSPPPELSDPDVQVHGILEGLNNATTPLPGETAWESFTRAQSTLVFDEHELNLPKCTDDQPVTIDGHTAFRVVTWFTTDLPPERFEHWTDPRRWHLDCCLFYERLTEKVPSTGKSKAPTGQQEFGKVTFEEVVRFTPLKTLTTDLAFTRTVGAELFACHFQLADPNGTPDIVVDSGSLVARYDPDAPGPRKTRITAEKCIAFTDPAMALWPTLCCDLLWTELTMTVALGCAQDAY